jgi:hypothetical protein
MPDTNTNTDVDNAGEGGTPATGTPATPAAGATPDAAAEQLKRVNAEAKQHRLDAKDAKAKLAAKEAELERYKAVVKTLDPNHKDGATPDPAAAQAAAQQTKMRDVLLRAEFVAEATKAGVVDPVFTFNAVRGQLKDVTVDLDAETVDTEALQEKLAGLKTTKPFLFTPKVAPVTTPKPGEKVITPPPPDGNGAPAAGNHYATWRNLLATGRKAEANAYYAANKTLILTQAK